MDEKPSQVLVIKCGRRKDAHHPEDNRGVHTGELFTGWEFNKPSEGNSFFVWASPECLGGMIVLVTSTVMSVYVHDETSGQDKLVLPKDFPDVLHMDFPELKPGDKLVATMNSVYLVRGSK